MLDARLKIIARFNLAGDRDNPGLDLGVRHLRHTDLERDFILTICGNGFEAWRNLSRDELIAIQDWIHDALAATGKDAA